MKNKISRKEVFLLLEILVIGLFIFSKDINFQIYFMYVSIVLIPIFAISYLVFPVKGGS